jgi:hypothetical protein
MSEAEAEHYYVRISRRLKQHKKDFIEPALHEE